MNIPFFKNPASVRDVTVPVYVPARGDHYREYEPAHYEELHIRAVPVKIAESDAALVAQVAFAKKGGIPANCSWDYLSGIVAASERRAQ